MNKAVERLYREREQRVMNTISLEIPDRVPVITSMGYFPARYTGIRCSAAWYDYEAWLSAYKKTLQDFQPDMTTMQPFYPGKVMDLLDLKTIKLPGWGISPDHGHQSIEFEYMRADEYGDWLKDPSDYLLREYFSRISGAAAGLEKLPSLSSIGYSFMGVQTLAESLARPEVSMAVRALQKAGREIRKWNPKIIAFMKAIEDLGFPPFVQGAALAPFDWVSHSIRGMHGSFTDMFRHPDKLLETCEKLLAINLSRPLPPPNRLGNTRIFMPLTRGSDDFMSLKQFDTFYWPTLKKLIEHLIAHGATPCVFFEGNFTTRLERLLDLPKGKILAKFDTTDMVRAKEVLKGHTCIQGNVPSSLLQVGTVEQVKDYCRMLIDTVGKNGGFILSPRSSTDEVDPRNFKAMIEFTKEYGVYS